MRGHGADSHIRAGCEVTLETVADRRPQAAPSIRAELLVQPTDHPSLHKEVPLRAPH